MEGRKKAPSRNGNLAGRPPDAAEPKREFQNGAKIDSDNRDAVNNGSLSIKEFTAGVENDKVTSYRVNAKVTSEMERT